MTSPSGFTVDVDQNPYLPEGMRDVSAIVTVIATGDGPVGGRDDAAISYPESCPERRFPLSGTQVRVGRRSVSRGIQPEIDLTGPPADPGVSRLHLLLIPSPDGTWSVVDPGSANGVLVNDTPMTPGEAVPLRDGDRIHLGAWTALTIASGAPASGPPPRP